MNFLKDKSFLVFVVKFLLIFAFFYLGTIAVIGYAAPGNRYSPFIDHYFDYVSGLKITLMKGAAVIASVFGYHTIEMPGYIVRVPAAKGVIIAYDCVGYGVMSFWIAFVLASEGTWKKRLLWLFGGLLFIWIINVIRIGMYLVALNKGWPMPLGFDHHTWFNVFAYGGIFLMIWRFSRQPVVGSQESP